MMLRIFTLILITLVHVTSWADDEIKCNSSGNQMELNACAGDDFAKADKELNTTYQSILKKEAADRLFTSRLRLAQKAWLAFRDAELAAQFACSEEDVRICWGSMYPLLFLSRKAELTRQRTAQLQQLLKDGRGN